MSSASKAPLTFESDKLFVQRLKSNEHQYPGVGMVSACGFPNLTHHPMKYQKSVVQL